MPDHQDYVSFQNPEDPTMHQFKKEAKTLSGEEGKVDRSSAPYKMKMTKECVKSKQTLEISLQHAKKKQGIYMSDGSQLKRPHYQAPSSKLR